MIARTRVVRIDGAPAVPKPEPADDAIPWPPARTALGDADPIAAHLSDDALALMHAEVNGSSASAEAGEEAMSGRLVVPTKLEPEQLLERLRAWEPWQHEIFFSNGVRTSQLATTTPFIRFPLAKWHVFEPHVPENPLEGGRALDVGSNIGQYSLFLRSRYGMQVTGVERSSRNVEVARFLAETSGHDGISFLEADANEYVADEQYDLIVHFGTLDHLKNPFLALENAATMLRPGGFLALELQTYRDPDDDRVCLFARPRNSESACRWFLGSQAVLDMLEEAGFGNRKVLLEWASPEAIGPKMRRLSVLAELS